MRSTWGFLWDNRYDVYQVNEMGEYFLAKIMSDDYCNRSIAEVESDIEDMEEGYTCLSIIQIHTDKAPVILYDAKTIRDFLAKEVHPDYEGMSVLHLVSDAEIEKAALEHVINTRAAKKEFEGNAMKILELATAEPLKKVRAVEDRNRKIERLLATINSRSRYYQGSAEDSEQRYSRIWDEIVELYQGHESPTSEEIASRVLGELRRLSGDLLQQAKSGVMNRKTLDNLLSWAATNITLGE